MEERDADALLDERDLWDSDLETRESGHHWVGARDVWEDVDSMLQVRLLSTIYIAFFLMTA